MILGVYGYSNSGKTTLIERLITELTQKGYKVSTIKHSNEKISLDTPGKDTYRHRDAGANISCLISASETTLISKSPLSLDNAIKMIEVIGGIDLILIEGGKSENIPKIAVGEIELLDKTIYRYSDNLDNIIEHIENTIIAERGSHQDSM
jgi:molybdopterin-guanine dinucleotide biosynthesis protein B